MRLQGKVAVITGASRGIGRAIALRFAEEGATVALCARNREALEALAQELTAQGRKAHVFPLDVTKQEAVKAVIDGIQKAFGRIDILVNNAGIKRDELLLRLKEKDWDEVLHTNLDSLFYCTKAVSRFMLKQHSGRIINLSSIVAAKGNPGQSAYAATKAGIIGFSKSVAVELASRNITVNVIAPGYIDTEMTAVLPDEVKAIAKSQVPFARFGTPREVADAAVFLASEEASYITGHVLHVNGGLLMV